MVDDEAPHAPPLLSFDEAVDVLQAREHDLQRADLERHVRELLPESFVINWKHRPGPFSECYISLRFAAQFSVHLGTPRAVVAELVDIARCHVIRLVARAVTGGI